MQPRGCQPGSRSSKLNRYNPRQVGARVQAAIERLGFVGSEAARSLRAGQSRIIGHLVLDMANPFFAEVAAGAARAAAAAGLRVMLCNSDNDRGRRGGARAALTAHGLPADALVHIEADRMDVASGRDAGRGPLTLSRVPTAVFCANDLLALGVLQAMYAAGVSVPAEMAIVGYDDIEFAAAAAVPLTSVRQPSAEMGQIAAGLLVDEVTAGTGQHRHRRVVLEPELVVRESSRRDTAPAGG
jgi:DNA-binding LacI/PurR family transcriptional regulator